MNCIEFVEGPISLEYISRLTETYSNQAGAMLSFYGRVREEHVRNKKIVAIEFETDAEMSQIALNDMLQDYDEKQLIRLSVLHSLGRVERGEICFVIILETAHRKEAFKILPDFISDFKARIPIFGKELFDDDTYVWKVNK